MFAFSRDAAFAKSLVEQLTRELPADLIENRRKVLSVNKVTRQLERVYAAAVAYRHEHRLGFIRRAAMANSFRWQLKESGYPDDFIDVATEGLVVEITKPQGRTPGPKA